VADVTSDRAVEAERLRHLFRIFAATQCRGRSPVYETLSEGVVEDDGLLGLLLSTPGNQRRPSLLFAAVNLLLASCPGSELAAYYPIHGGRRPADGRLVPAFAAFCAEHRGELDRLLRDRSTQTNEVRRCVALYLGLNHVRRHWPGPLALVEIGASAGLNLLFDHYQYRLDRRNAFPAAASPVTISCEVRDGASGDKILGTVPEITRRLGIDQHPVNVADPDARAWLEAFIWPEQVDDLATLRNAVDLAVATPIMTIVRGDATADTARLLGDLPGTEPIAVFTASLLSYLTADARTAFAAQLQQAARRRRVAWIFAEAPGLVATTTDLSVTALDGPLARRNSRYLVGASLRGPGRHDDALLALADPYLRWLAPARHPADDFRWVDAERP
jgi:hypothetical protein